MHSNGDIFINSTNYTMFLFLRAMLDGGVLKGSFTVECPKFKWWTFSKCWLFLFIDTFNGIFKPWPLLITSWPSDYIGYCSKPHCSSDLAIRTASDWIRILGKHGQPLRLNTLINKEYISFLFTYLLRYWCYYPHRSRDDLSPVCRIFCLKLPYILSFILIIYFANTFLCNILYQ